MRNIDKRYLLKSLEILIIDLKRIRRLYSIRNKNLNPLIAALIYLTQMEINDLTKELENE